MWCVVREPRGGIRGRVRIRLKGRVTFVFVFIFIFICFAFMLGNFHWVRKMALMVDGV